MKIQKKISPTTIVEVEGDTVAELFEHLGEAEQVFGFADKCGLCGCAQLRHQARMAQDKYKYFELVCTNRECRAKFTFGQSSTTKGMLFPQLKDKSGQYKANGGWERWEGSQDQRRNADPHQYSDAF